MHWCMAAAGKVALSQMHMYRHTKPRQSTQILLYIDMQ